MTPQDLSSGVLLIVIVEGKVEKVLFNGKEADFLVMALPGVSGAIKDGLEDDHGGHLIASMFNGLGEQINYVPMNKKVNGSGGEWGSLERLWKNELEKGKKVTVDIKPIYTGNNKRPDAIAVSYAIGNEKRVARLIENIKQ
ncbi:hypothetical protein F0231_01260 [Vibrio sp. RE86]|uniref:DNA/RNA non-specific endonuclease n=1 Tax=Vibrio sp. RE86 TaxID=2607605 RepID=UPI0016B469D7|nr:DNA/RNA non-specific endonuclease [Vibrio sp. RE86]NOH78363.1 hypothetical protein [Vibrio sp. RE86]